MRPGEVEVGSEAGNTSSATALHADGLWRAVGCGKLSTYGLVFTGVLVVHDVRHDEVFGAVVEAVQLEVEPFHPPVAGK